MVFTGQMGGRVASRETGAAGAASLKAFAAARCGTDMEVYVR
jgi:hypothetical protein